MTITLPIWLIAILVALITVGFASITLTLIIVIVERTNGYIDSKLFYE